MLGSLIMLLFEDSVFVKLLASLLTLDLVCSLFRLGRSESFS